MTDSPPSPQTRVVSARARILGWIMVLVTGALLVSVFATYTVLSSRLDARLDSDLNHEVDKFRGFTATGTNPYNGQPYQDVGEVLEVYLQRSLPEDHETYLALLDGDPYRRSAEAPPARLDRDASFISSIAGTTRTQYGWVDTTAGPARYAAIPVTVEGQDTLGHFVVAEFRDTQAADITEAMVVMAGVGIAALGLASVGGWLVTSRILAPVRLVRATAERISESDLSQRIPVRGHDDVAALTRTFNTMLDRLEESFDSQRRFLDDASHELRTPITVVRGHLELLDRGVTDSDERADTISLVMDELDRMRRMVDDLLLLAKSRAPDFLRTGPVDLADLTVEVLAKARPLGDRHFSIDEMAEATIGADSQRLTQALLQLVSNAVRHTGPGGEIALGSRVDDGVARLWVRDNGAGVPAEDYERIFERFASGQGHDSSGAGLGLAIVRAIAIAHKGQVTVGEADGGGALFTLEVPLP